MPLVIYTVEIETDTSGDFSGETDVIVGGEVIAAFLRSSTLTTGTVDISVVTEVGKIPVWVQSDYSVTTADIYPLAVAHTVNGVELEYETGINIRRRIPLADERILVTVAQGGSEKSAVLQIAVQENEYRPEVEEE